MMTHEEIASVIVTAYKVHVDRDNVFPMHHQILKENIAEAIDECVADALKAEKEKTAELGDAVILLRRILCRLSYACDRERDVLLRGIEDLSKERDEITDALRSTSRIAGQVKVT